jgi:hypothetical protein
MIANEDCINLGMTAVGESEYVKTVGTDSNPILITVFIVTCGIFIEQREDKAIFIDWIKTADKLKSLIVGLRGW